MCDCVDVCVPHELVEFLHALLGLVVVVVVWADAACTARVVGVWLLHACMGLLHRQRCCRPALALERAPPWLVAGTRLAHSFSSQTLVQCMEFSHIF